MSAFVVDPFQSVAAGTTVLPNNWEFIIGFESAFSVQPYSAGGPATPHNWCSFIAEALATPAAAFTETAMSINFFSRFTGNGFVGPFMNVYSISSLTGLPVIVAVLYQEGDGTISVYVGGSPDLLVCNSGNFPAAVPIGPVGVWTYFQINLQLGVDGDTQLIEITAEIGINGVSVAEGGPIKSNYTHGTDLYPIAFTQVSWASGYGKTQDLAEPFLMGFSPIPTYPGGVWTVTVADQGTGYHADSTVVTVTGGGGSGFSGTIGTNESGEITAVYFLPGSGYLTNPTAVDIVDSGTPPGTGAVATAAIEPAPVVRIPQAVVELGAEQTTAKVRIPQAAVETGILPTTAKVRIAQMVIELATIRLPPPAQPCGNLVPSPSTDTSFTLEKVVASFKKPTIRLPVR
jgi:hypothetical protein